MMKRIIATSAVAIAIGMLIGPALSGEPQNQPQEGEQAQQFEMKPVELTPQHKMLADREGTWKVKQTMYFGPEPVVSEGREVVRVILGGRAVVYDYESSGEGGIFQGHGLTTWNVTKQKYQAYWVDTMSVNGAEPSWGTYDEATKTLTSLMDTMGPDGKPTKMRMVDKSDGKDKHTLTFFMPGPDGQEMKTMELVYTRLR